MWSSKGTSGVVVVFGFSVVGTVVVGVIEVVTGVSVVVSYFLDFPSLMVSDLSTSTFAKGFGEVSTAFVTLVFVVVLSRNSSENEINDYQFKRTFQS